MKSIRLAAIAFLAALGLGFAATSALAYGGGYHGGGHYYGGGHYHGGYWGGGWHGSPYWGFGISLGVPYPYWGPSYYYGAPAYGYGYPYYPAPGVAVPAEPPTYIERNDLPPPDAAPPAASAPANWWYWCPSAQGYYPYVKACPEGWQRVAPQQ
jgi:hypothetical protein